MDPRFNVPGRLPDFHTNIADGKVRFHYEVVSTTNFGGHTFPLEFKYSEFAPDPAGGWHPQSIGFGRVSSIKKSIKPLNVFEPGRGQSINDWRFFGEYLTSISYTSREMAAALPTNDPGLQKIFVEEELRRKAGLNREPISETAGIGALLRVRGQDVVIEELSPDSPAAAQHIHAGDRIVAVAQGNGPAVQVRNMALSQAVQLIRGQNGTTVRLTIVPSGEDDSHARVVSLVRAELPEMSGLVNGPLLTNGTKAPDTAMVWLANGTSERLADFAGKIVVLEFWATWSVPCEQAVADLQSYFARNPDWKDKVILIAASVDDKAETATKLLKAKGWEQTHNVWVGADAIKAWHIGAIPRTYVMDRQGTIVAGDPPDIPEIVNQALGSRHATEPRMLPIRIPSAKAASSDMDTNTLPDLMRMLQKDQPSNDESRDRVLFAIVRLGPKAKPALPLILPLLTNQNSHLKIHALVALNAIGPDTETVRPFVPALLQILGDEDWTIRLAALRALAALRPPPQEVAVAFLRLLNDPEDPVRSEAMYSLVNQTNAMVIPVLDQRLHDRDSFVVTRAAVQIGAFGAAAAMSEPQLRELLDSPLLTVRQAASNALLAITGEARYQSAPAAANADITYHFSSIPFGQVLSVYEGLAGKKVTMKAAPKSGNTLSVLTVRPLTKSEALQLLEELFKEQAGLVIVHGADGSLTAVAKPQPNP
jgi:HEAT repeat protein/peroxiredoxin